MKLFATIAKRNGQWESVIGPEVPFAEQRQAISDALINPPPGVEFIRLCELVPHKELRIRGGLAPAPGPESASDEPAQAGESNSSGKKKRKG